MNNCVCGKSNNLLIFGDKFCCLKALFDVVIQGLGNTKRTSSEDKTVVEVPDPYQE